MVAGFLVYRTIICKTACLLCAGLMLSGFMLALRGLRILLPFIFGGTVIPPFLMGASRRIHAAVFSFMAGVMPPMPMLGRSLL